jgi:hypothetical protein
MLGNGAEEFLVLLQFLLWVIGGFDFSPFIFGFRRKFVGMSASIYKYIMVPFKYNFLVNAASNLKTLL